MKTLIRANVRNEKSAMDMQKRNDMSGDKSALYERFVHAASRGWIKTVRKMLWEGMVHVDGFGWDCKSALYEACKAGHLPVVQALIRAGADVNFLSWPDENTALHGACTSGKRVEVVEALLNAGANVDTRNKYGVTALILILDAEATHVRNRVDIARLLLIAKCDVNLQDADGWTALHHATATAWGRRNSIKELLVWKPDLTCKTFDGGHTALHSLFLEKNDRPEHENGYRSDEVNIQDTGGRTVLHVALERSKGDDLAVLEYLSSVADVSIANERGASALHTALYCGASQAVISALLGSTHGAVAANMRNGKGRTALHHAMVRKKMDAALAIARITEMNVADHQGRTALHHAVLLDELGFLEFLLHEREANPFLRDHRGHTPLALACKRDTRDRNSQLSSIYALLQYGVAYGKLQNMV